VNSPAPIAPPEPPVYSVPLLITSVAFLAVIALAFVLVSILGRPDNSGASKTGLFALGGVGTLFAFGGLGGPSLIASVFWIIIILVVIAVSLS
jgi:hypothetical protein